MRGGRSIKVNWVLGIFLNLGTLGLSLNLWVLGLSLNLGAPGLSLNLWALGIFLNSESGGPWDLSVF